MLMFTLFFFFGGGARYENKSLSKALALSEISGLLFIVVTGHRANKRSAFEIIVQFLEEKRQL